MKTFLAACSACTLAIGSAALASGPVHWAYAGEEGPENWQKLSTDFAECGMGRMQSPIDLGESNSHGFLEVAAHYSATPLTILNNGHTVQVNFATESSLVSGGAAFKLLQVHFHTPSEHAVSGKRYPLVAHFVHSNANGELAVLGVFFEEGAANAELDKIVAAAPHHHQDAQEVSGVTFDPAGMVPGDLSVYRYMGSLTTPPCSEGVNWHVAIEPMTASAEQLAALREIMGDNARPVQQRNNRLLVSR